MIEENDGSVKGGGGDGGVGGVLGDYLDIFHHLTLYITSRIPARCVR